MDNTIKCPHWREYQGLNGWVMVCSAGAFAQTFVRPEAERIGCTEERRAKCRQIMELNLGYALQPEIIERADTAEEAVLTAVPTHFPDFAAEKSLDDYPALLTIDMVADYLNLSLSKTMALIDNGSLPVVSSDGEIKVEKAKLEEWLKCTA